MFPILCESPTYVTFCNGKGKVKTAHLCFEHWGSTIGFLIRGFCQVWGGTGRSGLELSGVTPEWKGFDNKVGEQPWPQLVHCASIYCRVCSCVFQED